ncbi:MAG: hypothetical protein WDO19_12120 [Bacteroidota bacterium]
MPLLSRADFNCPGGGVMMLDGKAALKEDNAVPKGDLHLDKIETSTFTDEWNYVIDNYLVGTNDPDIIDSIGAIARHETTSTPPETAVVINPPVTETTPVVVKQKPIEQPIVTKEAPKETQPVVTTIIEPSKAPTIEEKFLNRKKFSIEKYSWKVILLSFAFMIMRK